MPRPVPDDSGIIDLDAMLEQADADGLDVNVVDNDTSGSPEQLLDTEGNVIDDTEIDDGPGVPVLPHAENIATALDENTRRLIVDDILAAVQSDDAARADWLSMYRASIKLLGFTFECVSEPWEGASSAVHPLLAAAVVAFQARSVKTLFPPAGPVKSKVIGLTTPFKMKAAARVVSEMNTTMTKHRDYRNELEKALFVCGLCGSGFVKTWEDGLTGRPLSYALAPEDVILSPDASDICTADRATHVLRKHLYEVKDMMARNVWRDAKIQERRVQDSGPSNPMPTDIDDERSKVGGIDAQQDQRYLIHEVTLRLRLGDFDEQFAPYDDPDGVPLPYVLTYETESLEMLGLYRNWAEDDPTRQPLEPITQYTYIVSHLSPYGIGLMHLIGQTTEAVTAILRSLIDAGSLANLQAGFKTRGLRVRNENTPLRPGEFRDVDVAAGKIQENIYPLQFKEPSTTLLNLMSAMEDRGEKLATVASASLEEMPHNAASFAVLAILERELEPQAAVHIRLHAAFTHQIKQIAEIIKDGAPDYSHDVDGDPNTPNDPGLRKSDFSVTEITLVSNPNEASAGAKLMKLQVVQQLAQQFPQEFNTSNLIRYAISLMGEPDFEPLLKQTEEPQPTDPVSENMNLLTGKPIKVFMQQDHESHLRVHLAAMQDPKIMEMVQKSPNAQALMGAAQSHIAEHMSFQYRRDIERELGVPMPPPGQPLPPEQEAQLSQLCAEAAERVSGLHAKEQQLKEAEDPVVQMQQQEAMNESRKLDIDEEDRREKRKIEAAKVMVDAVNKKASVVLKGWDIGFKAAQDMRGEIVSPPNGASKPPGRQP